MVSARHKYQTLAQGIHGIVAYEYADSTARLAATGFIDGDLYKLAIQLDNNSLWILTSISPITWVNAQNNLSFSGETAGDILYFNGTEWVVLHLGDDGYVLAANTALTQPNWVPPSGGTATANFALAAGTQTANSGTVVFSNSNGISFGMSGSSRITASYTVPSTAGLISNVNISAGTTSNNLTALTFSNSNGLAFGLDGSTITGSYTVPSTAGLISNINVSAGTTSNNLNAITFSNSNGLAFGLDGSTITGSYTVPVQTNQTVGLYVLGNTTQNSSTTLDARTLSFNGLGIITAGFSNGSIQLSATQSAQTQNVVVPSAGTQTATSGTVVFSNSNGISFGMSGSSRITASYTVPSTAGLISAVNISGGTTSNNLTALTFSDANNVSFGLDGSTLTATASFNQTVQTQNVVVPSAGTQTATSGTVVFSNSNGISFGMSGSSRITASYTVPSTAGLISAVNISGGTTSNNLTALTFSNSNNVSFGLNGSTITATATFAQTNQTIGGYAVGNTTGESSSSTFDARSISFDGAGIASVGYSNSSIVISVPAQSVQTQSIVVPSAGTQTATSGTVVFSNSNGISFGMSGSSRITASYTVPSTAGLISAVNISAGTTSNNLSALTFSDSNGLAFGLDGSTITGSYTVPSTAGLISAVNISAGTTSNNLTALTFSNSNNVSFGLNGSTITATASFVQTNQTVGLYALGNTTQNSSTTLDARSLSFDGLGIITAGYSNGSIQLSATQSAQTQNIVVPSAGTQTATSGTVVFSNSNGISFGMSGSSRITASYTVPSTAGLISAVNISAGTTSNNLTALTFSNINGISFGLDASTITASYTVPTQTNQTIGLYALGNTTQNSSTTLDARTLSFNGLGGATVGYSNGSIQISAPTTVGLISAVNVSAGTTSNNLTAFTFADSNGISFGLDGSTITASIMPVAVSGIGAIQGGTQTATSGTVVFSNSNGISFGLSGSSRMTASYTVPSTAGLISNINVSAGTTSNDLNAITFSDSNGLAFGLDGSTITGSYTVPSTAGLISNINISAGTTSNNLTALTFSNSNNISFGLDGSTITATATFAQTNQTIAFFALGNTTQNSSTTRDARSVSFNGLGIITVGYSNGSIQLSATTAAQTNQTLGLYAVGNTTQNSSTTLDARTLSFNGLGAATVGYSNGSIQISVPNALTNINVSAGTTSNNLTALTFSNVNGVSFGLNASTITASVAAQTNQTIGLYALGNTTQNSSTTLDARTLSFNGLGIITAGYSNGSIQLSATQSAQTQNVVVPSAGTQTATSGTVIFSNSNGISFGMSNSSVITASYTVPTQTNQTIGLYAVGNTTQNSSTTLDARTLSFDGLGAASIGYSNGSIQISVPVQSAQTQSNIQAIYDGVNSISTGTIQVSNSNGVSFGINGQTLTASIAPRKVFQLGPDSPWQTNFLVSNASFSLQHFIPRADIIATQANLLMALSGNTNSSGALTISLGIYTMLGSTMSLASSTSRQITWTSGSQTTASSLYGGISGTCYRTVPLGNWSFTAGDYMIGVWCRTTNNGTWRVFGTQGPSIVNAQDVNETQMYIPGYFSTGSFTTAMVASINLTDTNYVRTGIPVLQQPSIMFAGTV